MSKEQTTIETTAISLFNSEFGTDKLSRFKKVTEEFNETAEAFEKYLEIPSFGKVKDNTEHLKDEISDLYATVTHFASLFNLNHNELLEMAIDKVETRKLNPNYKRL